jgi:P-type Cu2+ transporter
VSPGRPCTHCGTPVALAVGATDDGIVFCCAGCEAVYHALRGAGLEDYYRFRESLPAPIDAPSTDMLELEDPERWIVRDGDRVSCELAVSGIHCASCAWVIEETLRGDDLVRAAHVSLANERVRLDLADGGEQELRRLLERLTRVGYGARPLRPGQAAGPDDRAARMEILRLGVAAACSLNIMLFAISLYGGDAFGIEPRLEVMFRWLSLLLATPIVAFSAWPILHRAVASLRRGMLHVDVPISLAITVMFGASAVATVTGRGEVWFDSLGMLVALLLGGRMVESSVRRRTGRRLSALLERREPLARRLGDDGEVVTVPAEVLKIGDRVELRPGDVAPCDLEIIVGRSDIDLAVVDGESRPVLLGPGAELPAGARLLTGRLEATVVHDPGHSSVERVRRAVERALERKSPVEVLADRVARVFVFAVLVIGAATFAAWLHIDPSRALRVTIAVLVVACPCALALATPLAFASALHGAAARGLLVRSGGVLLKLARTRLLAFDKTGTLTEERPEPGPLRLTPFGDELGEQRILILAAAAARSSLHPVAQAVVEAARLRGIEELPLATDLHEEAGRGLEARVDGHIVRIGRPGATVELDGRRAGRLQLSDRIRPDAAPVVRELTRQGLAVALLSGDLPDRAEALAAAVGIAEVHGGMRPEQKAAWIAARSDQQVTFVGDGLNDAEALAVAHVGLAMGHGVDLSVEAADGALLRRRLDPLVSGIQLGRELRRILVQNVSLSLLYNAAAVAAAAAGLVSPLVAAVLMPFSSILVVSNASRLARKGDV